MKTYLAFGSIMTILVAIGCAGKMESSDLASASQEATPQAVSTIPASLNTDLYSDGFTKLIKTANYRFEVDNMQQSIAAIELIVQKHGAFISSSDQRLNNPMLESKVTIRVPSEHFHGLLKEIDEQARFVNYRDIRTEEVAKQFVDLESRLKTKREVEQRYMDILRKKAGTIEELLKAEEQIGQLHEEIEATVSRLNHLKDEVKYNTVNLELYQRVEHVIVANDASAMTGMREALASGWNGLITVFTGILYLWPLVILTSAGIIIYRMFKKRQGVMKGA